MKQSNDLCVILYQGLNIWTDRRYWYSFGEGIADESDKFGEGIDTLVEAGEGIALLCNVDVIK